jgi:hypothetical protein
LPLRTSKAPGNPEDNAEDSGANSEDNAEDSRSIPRIPRKYRLSEDGRANLASLGRSRWAASEELERREAEVEGREAALAEAGPEDLGLAQCGECEGWFDPEGLAPHRKSTHPIDRAVAEDLAVARSRVASVWTEACQKQGRHARAAPEQIIDRFWDETDRRILKALRAKGAAFRFSKTE